MAHYGTQYKNDLYEYILYLKQEYGLSVMDVIRMLIDMLSDFAE